MLAQRFNRLPVHKSLTDGLGPRGSQQSLQVVGKDIAQAELRIGIETTWHDTAVRQYGNMVAERIARPRSATFRHLARPLEAGRILQVDPIGQRGATLRKNIVGHRQAELAV